MGMSEDKPTVNPLTVFGLETLHGRMLGSEAPFIQALHNGRTSH